MTAWQTLVANSSLSMGTAWQHLNAQVGGTAVEYQYFGALEVTMDTSPFVVTLENNLAVQLVDDQLQVVLEEEVLEVTLDANTDD